MRCRACHDASRLGKEIGFCTLTQSTPLLVLLCHYRCFCTVVSTDVYGELPSFLRLSDRLTHPPFRDIFDVDVLATIAFPLFSPSSSCPFPSLPPPSPSPSSFPFSFHPIPFSLPLSLSLIRLEEVNEETLVLAVGVGIGFCSWWGYRLRLVLGPNISSSDVNGCLDLLFRDTVSLDPLSVLVSCKDREVTWNNSKLLTDSALYIYI